MPVPEGLAGMRVDAGLARLLGLSRTAVATIAEDGGVDIDGAPAAKSDKLVAGSWLEVRLPEAPAPLENTPQDIEGMAILYSDEQIRQMAAYVASLGPGPGIPDEKYSSGEGANLARGGELFRVNCSMCHNYAGSGGALTRGKHAPPLRNIEGRHLYAAMLTGPQSMPVFSDTNLTPEDKRDIIGYLHELDKGENFGGHGLGAFGPVGDGFFLWLIAVPIMLGAAIWLGRKAA